MAQTGLVVEIGVGLPTSTPDPSRELLLTWARRTDSGPFSSLGTVDRLLYPCWEPLAALGLAAAVTTRVRLATMILIGPLRRTALLAKEASTLDALSGGRLVLGLGIGARHDDYTAAGIDHRTRGLTLARQLYELGESLGCPLLVGGGGGQAFARTARLAAGYCHGGGPPRAFAGAAARARAAWRDAGRPGEPQLWGQGYFALGDEATVERGRDHLRDYYRFTGGFEERIAAGCLTTPAALKDFVRAYREEGCDELVLFPTVSRLDQLERLADLLG